MSNSQKTLRASSSVGDWLQHPVGGPLIRELLAAGGMDESSLKPVRTLPLERLVELSQGALPQEAVDGLVLAANGGQLPPEVEDDEVDGPAVPDSRSASGPPVAVVIGVGGMGQAIARREGGGRKLVLADFDATTLDTFADTLRGEGYDVTTSPVDVAQRQSVAALAALCASLGSVVSVVHTAGLSPSQAPIDAILAVDLFGVAVVLEEFERVIAAGGSGVIISSNSAYQTQLDAETEQALATLPADELLALPAVVAVSHPGEAYPLAKRGNQLRVQAASNTWGARGARINSVSPGIISTPMGQQELNGEYGDVMRAMIDGSATGRIGTPTDIADAVAFLLGPTATFVTGVDLLVDGGVIAAGRGV